MRNFFIFLVYGWAHAYLLAFIMIAGRTITAYFIGGAEIWGAVLSMVVLLITLGAIVGGALANMTQTIRMVGAFVMAAGAAGIFTFAQGGNMIVWTTSLLLRNPSVHPAYGAMLATLIVYGLPIWLLSMVTPYTVRLMRPPPEEQADYRKTAAARKKESTATVGWILMVGGLCATLAAFLVPLYFVRWYAQDNIILGLIILSTVFGLSTFFVASSED